MRQVLRDLRVGIPQFLFGQLAMGAVVFGTIVIPELVLRHFR